MNCEERIWSNDNEISKLYKEIVHGSNEEYFKTFSIETGGGKTTTAIDAMCDAVSNPFIDNKYIFVSKFKSECIKIVKEINSRFNDPVAIALIFDENIKDECCTNNIFKIKNYKIVITTHSTYCNMSNPKSDKHIQINKIIKNNFETLIIDEEINPVKDSYFEFSKAEIESLQVMFNTYNKEIGNKFRNLVDKLLKELNSDEYRPLNQLHRIKEIDEEKYVIDQCYLEIKTEIKNMNEEWLEDNTDERTLSLLNKLEHIYDTWIAIFDNIALINVKEGKIYSYNYMFNYLMLKNNIWLDASAIFNTMYCNKLFDVVETERIIDHSKCKVNVIKIKTTTSSKNVDKNFRDDITKYINENINKDSKGLVLTKKTECESLSKQDKYLKNNENVAILNFENMRGVNDYSDYKQCFYIHTYRMSPAYYVFLYEYFNDTVLSDKEIQVKRINNIEWGFGNKKEIQDLMISDMASSMYQGLKRVQRNRNPEAIFHIFSKEIGVIGMALKQMNGLVNKDLMNVLNERPKGNKQDIINFVDNIWDKKRVTCKDVYEELGIDKKIWSAIWKDENFLSEMKKRRVKIGLTKHSKKTMYLMKY